MGSAVKWCSQCPRQNSSNIVRLHFSLDHIMVFVYHLKNWSIKNVWTNLDNYIRKYTIDVSTQTVLLKVCNTCNTNNYSRDKVMIQLLFQMNDVVGSSSI